MGMFITDKARIQQVDKLGYWKTIDNELYLDDNGELLLTPRYFWSDGYTFPTWVMPIIGDKHKFDVRPAHEHDLNCRFHEKITVKLSITALKIKGYIREHDGMLICEDIPMEYLKIKRISKKEADDYFNSMMKSCGIPKWVRLVLRFGVIFNLNWYFRTGKRSISSYNIYEEDIGLVNGL